MSADIMALYGPGSRIDGWPRRGRNTPTPEAKERLEAGLERLHRLWTDMVARYVDLLDAETPDADLEPSLAGFGGQVGSRDDREQDVGDQCEADWTDAYGNAFVSDMEPTLGAYEQHGPGHQGMWGAGPDTEEREEVSEDEGAQCDDEGARDNEDGCAVEDGSGEGFLGWTEAESRDGLRLTSTTTDSEPSLGSLTSCAHAGDQRRWADGDGSDDREEQCEDEGAADYAEVFDYTDPHDQRTLVAAHHASAHPVDASRGAN